MHQARNPFERTVLLAVVVATALLLLPAGAATFSPNHFLGKCLDDQWVRDMEATLHVSSTARDFMGRLEHPHLHAALPNSRYTIKDKRILNKTLDQIFTASCTDTPFTFWGVGAEVDPATGVVTNAGSPDGSLVVEYGAWQSHQLTTLVFSILATDVLGYKVSFYQSLDEVDMGARMSSASPGLCTPIHVNVEEWGRDFAAYANESYKAGIHNYFGRSGLYTTQKFVNAGADPTKYSPPFDAEFWRDYTWNEGLIEALNVDLIFQNKKYYPPADNGCVDGFLGCKNACSRTDACTAREQQGGKCIGIVFMAAVLDQGWGQAVLANKKIPSYHCFLGFIGAIAYAVEMEAKGIPVVFHMYEPDPFFFLHKNKFTRLFLPRTSPELVKVATGTFGENGYGKKTSNPVAVDFRTITLSLYGASLLLAYSPVASLLSRMTLGENDMNAMLQTYVDITTSSNGVKPIAPDDVVFSSACAWVRANYATWRLWLDRLPLCSLFEHVSWSYHHCDDGEPREVRWAWFEPDPLDATKPFVCDGGMTALPSVLYSSKSCAWFAANPYVWLAWTVVLPVCDANFYSFHVSECDAASKRTATYYWLLPDPADPTKSRECREEETTVLPAPVEFACEYAPYESPLARVITVLAAALAVVLSGLTLFVLKYRQTPIVKRSQFEFLLVMLVGGITICGAAILYGGAPSRFHCAARPLVTALGFTLIFGALVVKSLRVYRVFMSGAMKRVVLSTKMMFKILGLFITIDVLILAAWFTLDFPAPHYEPTAIGALKGERVDRLVCGSSSFIFSALLIFWKAIVLFMGLYLSFLIRNVSTDFQESIWIFASSLVVLFGSIIILPMAYLVELPADVFYAFLAFMLLACTALVMGMMLVPKMVRLKERTSEATTTETQRNEGSGTPSSDDTKPSIASKVSKLRFGQRAQVSVTPVQEFKPQARSKKKTGGPGQGPTTSLDDE